MARLNAEMRAIRIRRRRKPRMNMTAFVFHTVREQFGGRKGITILEFCAYLDENNIAYSYYTVCSAFRYLSGASASMPYRDEFTMRKLKKDEYMGKRGKEYPYRYYFNSAGTVRVTQVEGQGVWCTTGITGVVIAKLSRMTNTIVSIAKF